MSGALITGSRPDVETTVGPSRRVSLLDAIRGFCLVALAVEHLPEFPGQRLTHQTFGFFNLAEPFILVSGYFAGLVFGRELERSGSRSLWRRALRRASEIYLTRLAILAVLLAFALSGLVRPGGDRAPLFWTEPLLAAVLGALFLYQPMFLGVLPMYCVFVLAAPVVLIAIRRGHGRWVLGVSAGLWLAAQAGAGFVARDVWGIHLGDFNYLAWQVLFVAGIALGYRRARRVHSPLLGASSMVAVAGAAALVFFVVRHAPALLGAGGALEEAVRDLATRRTLGPLRLLDFAAAALAGWSLLVRVDPWIRQRLPYRWLAYLGQHSLQVFAWSVPVSYLAYGFEREWLGAGLWQQCLPALAAALSLTVPAALHARFRARGRGRKGAADPAVPIPGSPLTRPEAETEGTSVSPS